MRDVRCRRRELAEVLGLSERRVSELVRTGVLSKPEGTRGYALVACVKAYLAFLRSKSGSLTNERARLTKAQADLMELKLKVRHEELVEKRAVDDQAFRQAREVRDGILNVPDRVSGVVAAESDQFTVHQILTKELTQALEALCDHATPDRGPVARHPGRSHPPNAHRPSRPV